MYRITFICTCKNRGKIPNNTAVYLCRYKSSPNMCRSFNWANDSDYALAFILQLIYSSCLCVTTYVLNLRPIWWLSLCNLIFLDHVINLYCLRCVLLVKAWCEWFVAICMYLLFVGNVTFSINPDWLKDQICYSRELTLLGNMMNILLVWLDHLINFSIVYRFLLVKFVPLCCIVMCHIS